MAAHLRHVVRRDRRRIGKRLTVVAHEFRQNRERIRLDDEFVIPYGAAKTTGGIRLKNTSTTEPVPRFIG